jgi:hypothetical protein
MCAAARPDPEATLIANAAATDSLDANVQLR